MLNQSIPPTPKSWTGDARNLQQAMRDIVGAAAPEPPVNDAWGDVIPFEFAAPAPVPLEILPAVLKSFVESVSDAVQVPPALVLINVLACTAVAVQGKARVAVNADYSEPLNLYALAALPPGERKSAVTELCKRPLLDWQRLEAEQKAPDRIRVLSERKSAEKIIEARRNKLHQIKCTEERRAEIQAIAELELELPDVPALPRFFADDATPEALAALLAEQKERLGIIEAEGGLFETLAGRYSSGVPNLDLILKAWNGEPILVDRRRGDPLTLERPLLTLCVSCQPDVVAGLADKPGFRGRGLLAHFFYVLPESRVGYRSIDVSSVPSTVKNAYAAKIEAALSVKPVELMDGTFEPYMVRLSPAADALRVKFAEHIEMSMRPDGELESLKEWASKLPGNMLRLAGLLHFWAESRPLDQPISGQTMNTAITLAAVLVEHCKAAFALMGADEKLEAAKKILTWVKKSRSEPLREFSARDCWQGVRGSFKHMAEVQAGLDILEDRNFIAEIPRETTGPGRPSRAYLVNQIIFGGLQ